MLFRLQRDYNNYMEDFQARYAAALEQMADSLNAAAKRVNAAYNASYIFTYQNGGQLLYADPAHDITNEVIEELNRSFKSLPFADRVLARCLARMCIFLLEQCLCPQHRHHRQ